MPARPVPYLFLLTSLSACVGSNVAASGPTAAAPVEQAAPVQLPADYDPRASLAPLVETLSPAVVFIEVEARVEVQHPQLDIPEQWAPFFGIPQGGDQPQFRTQRGSGSGFVISADGYVLTNNHVVDDADKVTVTLADDREFQATVVGTDPRTDVALVKIDSDQALPHVQLGRSEELRVGDWVVAIGNPFGLTHTVTAGIVSAKGRVIGAGPYDDFIQTDASINPGNSGGPLFDLQGRVIGINTAIVPGGTGIGFAVPIDMVSAMLDDLKQDGRVARGWIGVGLRPLDDVLKEQLGADQGVVVSAVYPDNPAAQAGLAPGDVITAVDGQSITEADEVIRAIGLKKPGETVKLDALRDGKARTFKVTLGERPEEEAVAAGSFRSPGKDGAQKAQADAVERFGFRVEDRRDLGLRGTDGVVVTAVVGDSPAQGRLQVGDVLLQVNRQPVKAAADVARLLEKAERGAMLVVLRDGTETLVSLPSPEE
ncbi:Do family serine endopeptidase [Myxococcota bacterium]|nr:Do family serine endopeptidase [Myxococcota bacterium]